jgi:allantoicase
VTAPPGPPAFTGLPDLAGRLLGGSVVFANDDLFAEKENLIKPGPAEFADQAFGPRGKVYDGWETRRRREAGHDHAIIRLGVPGLVHGVVVDTAFFRGNYPPEVSVEAVSAGGYPSPAELAAMTWHPLVPRSPARGDTANYYPVASRHRWTHLRLSIYPDGGVARFRAHGEVLAAPAFLAGTVDLAALENGGRLVECSDAFYSTAEHLIWPGRARGMNEGWENARRRGNGNDFAVFALAAAGVPQWIEVDTSWFVGNAPGWVRLQAGDDAGGWREILPRTRVQPDTRHRFMVTGEPGPATRVRLDVYPDGGLARLRVHGEITADALAGLRQRWRDTAAPDGV